ncbi:type 2 isopentenyl-diphosphate Delta-isomerase [Vagococcus entomophilus]|uniref:Isopentenyl-diphosphate delta-isomerase n=1 Tax=Vagococcus entomophilus TaxID=1160095 RepID=A0A430AKW0_9ENTE|nr:type 2 isopentenyl-diphosphate Delta-isomerase [Vagococcus entomophilus]RSU08751.1 type 2 isopentenyl-diphosphate Delta-isomerase [Vagococcus entomophilus]
MTENRKDQHVAFAEKFYDAAAASDFERVRFIHHSFSETNKKNVSLTTQLVNTTLTSPFFINGMTGGSDTTAKINEQLAIVARETNLAMASGSASITLRDATTMDSFKIIRKTNPHGLIFANIGAEHPVENAKRVVDLLEADALQVHVNVPQELVMPEGGRDFSGWLTNIEKMVRSLDVPIIVKEVGFGMDSKTLRQLEVVGVKTVDISGTGGTNFASIENSRRKEKEYNFLENWGQSTAISLLESLSQQAKLDIIASGGIRSALDIVKALALGASAVGVSGQFLHWILKDGVDKTILHVQEWQEQIQTLMTLLGAESIAQLRKTDIMLSGHLIEWCQARGIDWTALAQRSE